MKHRVIAVVAVAVGLVSASWAGVSRADVTVIGGGFAEDCSRSAKAVSVERAPRADALQECTLALQTEVLGAHDLASTYVNRGVLFLAMARYDNALSDFNAALRVEPRLAEAFVNRGAALIGEGRNAEGVAEIDRGLTFNPSEPEKAYFNRALAEERLNDAKAAYYDYRRALELRPGWPMAQAELARFTVVQR